MTAEFDWWLLIVGLVVGGGLVWFVLMDSRRRDADIDAVERPREATWLSTVLAEEGWDVPPEAADRLLLLHREYLEAPPPDDRPATVPTDPTDPTDPRDDDAPREFAGASSDVAGPPSALPDDDGLGEDA